MYKNKYLILGIFKFLNLELHFIKIKWNFNFCCEINKYKYIYEIYIKKREFLKYKKSPKNNINFQGLNSGTT